MRKLRMIRKGTKSRKYRKDGTARERDKRECGQPHQTGRSQSRRREGNRKESEMNGEGCEEGERESGRGIRGQLSLVKMPPLTTRGNQGAWCRASEADKKSGGPSPPGQPHKSAG